MKWFRKKKQKKPNHLPLLTIVHNPDHIPSMGGIQDTVINWGSGLTEPLQGEGWFHCTCGVQYGTDEARVKGWQTAMEDHLIAVGVIRYPAPRMQFIAG